MKLYKDIVIDLYKPAPLAVLYVPQYNTARGARVTLVADSQIVTLTDETVEAYIKKPDGNIVYVTCTISGDNILVNMNEQATAVPGKLELELQIIGDGDNLVTPICEVVIPASNIDYAMLTSTNEFAALVDALNKVNNFEVIDPANAVAGDLGKCADAYYTHTAMEAQSADIAANAAAIRQQNENIELRTIKNVSLIFATATVAATSGELGGYYAMIDLDKASNITFPGGLKAILPLGCTRTDATGYVGVVAPYNWKSAYLITKQWAITAPTSGTYGVMFACFY